MPKWHKYTVVSTVKSGSVTQLSKHGSHLWWKMTRRLFINIAISDLIEIENGIMTTLHRHVHTGLIRTSAVVPVRQLLKEG